MSYGCRCGVDERACSPCLNREVGVKNQIMKTLLALALVLSVNLHAQTWSRADLLEGLFEPIEEGQTLEEVYLPLQGNDNKA